MMKTFEQNKELQNKYKDAYREVESFLKELKKKYEKDNKQPDDKTTSGEQPKAVIGSALVGIVLFATQNGSFSASSYPLVNSFILDCGSPVYICNNLDRFDQTTF